MKGRLATNLIIKTFYLAISLAMVFSSFPLVGRAAVSPTNIITYQGRLLDGAGAEVTAASASMSFALYDAASGGTCLWSNNSATCDSVVARTVTLTDALFTEDLGDTNASTPYADIADTVFANNTAVYLEVVVNSETLSPRKLLTAAPYALNAQTLDGIDSTTFLLATGDTGAGIFDFTGATFSGASPFVFEGAASDDFETFFTFTDPTADRIVTFQNASGTVAYTSDIAAGAGLWEVGVNGSYEDDAAVIIGADAAFSYVAGAAAGDLRIADDFETVDDGFIGGDLVVGASTSATETLANVGLIIGGDDLFVAGMAGIEGSVYTDGSFIAGASSTYGDGSITDSGGDFTFTLNAAGDDLNVITGNLKIGNGANDTALDGEDAYVEGSFEVDGIVNIDGAADFSANLVNSAGELLVSGGNMQLNDAIAMTFGTDNDLEITWDNTAVAFELDGALVSIGDDAGGTTATGDNDLFVADALEVDGTLDADGQVDLGDNGDTFSVDSFEFDVSSSTGSITINDGGDLGLLSVEGTVLDINSLDFVGGGAFTSTGATDITATIGNANNLFNVLTGNLKVGNGANDTALDGEDAYVDGSFEVDGIVNIDGAADFSANLVNSAGELLVSGGNMQLNDAIAMTFGTDNDLEITWDNTAVAFELDGALVSIGDDAGGTTATGDNDLFVADALEVDGTLDADGQVDLGDNGDTFSVDSFEFDVSSSTGSITINDGGDFGQISIETTILNKNTLNFAGGWGEKIDNATDDNITLTGVSGTNNTSIIFDLDGAVAAVPTIYSGNNDLINIYDGLSIGVDGVLTEDITDAGFAISSGNDLYIADMLGVNGSSFFDGSLNIPDDTQIILGNSDDATMSWVNASNDLLINNDTATGSTIFQLGTDTSATDFQIQNNSSSPLFSVDGSGLATFTRNITNTASTVNLVNIDFDQTYTGAGDISNTDNSLLITRNITMNSAGQTLNVNGNMVTISNNGTQTAGTLNEASSLLYIDQNYAAAGASIFQIDNASTSPTISLNQEGNSNALYVDSLGTGESIFDISVSNTSGVLFTTDYNAATSLAADLTGYYINLQTNVTEDEDFDITGFKTLLPPLTSNSAGGGVSTTIIGYNAQGGALHTDSNDNIYWSGFKSSTPSITEDTTGFISSTGFEAQNGTITTHGEQYGLLVNTGGNITDGDQYGVYVNNGSNTTGGTQVGFNMNANGVSAGYLYGINISNVTPGGGTEVAVKIGSGWDDAINVNAGAFVVETTGATDLETSLTIDAPVYVASGYVQRLCSSSGGDNGAALDNVMIVDCLDAGQADYAEMYPVASNITYGDIVVPGTIKVTTEKGETIVQMVKSISAYQNIFGGVVVNNYEDGTSAGYNIADIDNPMPVSLSGRVSVHVTDENGSISVGDPITTSSTAGYGMKATEPGMVVGYALNNFSGTNGEVMVFVHSGWYAGNILTTDGSATLVSDTLVMNSLSEASAVTPGAASQVFTLRGSGWNGSAAQSLDMKIQTEVTDTNNYRLSIKNTTDAEVAYITNEGTMTLAGDMIITGRFYPSDRGTTQTSKYIYYDGSAGPGGDMMRTNAAGWSTGSYDFAEMFPSKEPLESGDVVVFTGANENVGRFAGTYSAKIAGIVSTRPGFLAGENQPGRFPIALAGRVPTKVNLEGGSIAVGDPLTTSSTAGYAMKAARAGQIVGYALEPYTGGETDNKITVFVNVGYSNGEAAGIPGVSNTASLLATGASANFTLLNLEGSIYMGGNDILNIGRLSGLADLWSIEEDGTIKTEGAIKTIITSYQNEKVETAAMTSSGGVFVTLVGTTELQNGVASISFEEVEPTFNDVTSITAPIRIIVTPNGPVSLYVSEKDHNGFVIKQISGTDSGISVDWIVSAYRKDYEPKEKEEEEPTEEEEITAPIEEIMPEMTEPITEEVVETPETTEEPKTIPLETVETTPIVEETGEEVAEALAESPTQTSDPTVEGDGGIEAEPPSTDSVSINSSAQTGG